MSTQEAFQDAAYWRAYAKQLKRGIDRALQESTSIQPEQYANRVWSHLHNVVNAPVYPARPVAPVDEREALHYE